MGCIPHHSKFPTLFCWACGLPYNRQPCTDICTPSKICSEVYVEFSWIVDTNHSLHLLLTKYNRTFFYEDLPNMQHVLFSNTFCRLQIQHSSDTVYLFIYYFYSKPACLLRLSFSLMLHSPCDSKAWSYVQIIVIYIQIKLNKNRIFYFESAVMQELEIFCC